MGKDLIIWVDDMILQLGPDIDEAREKATQAIQLLMDLGFSINTVKTDRDVSKQTDFRGFR